MQTKKPASTVPTAPAPVFDNAIITNAITATAAASKPQFSCDWAHHDCISNTMQQSICQRDGCNISFHHLCQHQWQEKYGYIEDSCSWYCRQHNAHYQEFLQGKLGDDDVDFTRCNLLQLSEEDDETTTPPLPSLPEPNFNDSEMMTIGVPQNKLRASTTVSTTSRKGKK